MPRFARGALPWLLVPLALTLGPLAFLALPGLAWVSLLAIPPGLAFLFFLQFFRDPERSVADGVASPADGKVVRMDQVEDADVGRADRLSIFMSPKDVHVNRFPLDGRVLSVVHVPGGHIPAFDKDSHLNERVEWLLDTGLGRVKVIQIAGAVARRIVPYMQGGETVRKGERMGLIRLGSRCDLLVPPGSVQWTVTMGQQVHGAKDQVGILSSTPSPAGSASPPAGRPPARSRAPAAKRGAAAKAKASQGPGPRAAKAPKAKAKRAKGQKA